MVVPWGSVKETTLLLSAEFHCATLLQFLSSSNLIIPFLNTQFDLVSRALSTLIVSQIIIMASTCETRKKYTRVELFGLAESMSDTASVDRERLEKFKEARLIYNESIDCLNTEEEFDNGLRPKLNRTISNQLSFERKAMASSQRIPPRISRMTSSPSLKYNRSADQRQAIKAGDSISNQVKARYAELIENLTSSTSASLASGAQASSNQKRQLLTRSTSLNASQPDADHRRSVERPKSLFGPLRREISNYENHRDSDEPLSLPYVLTNTGNSRKSTAAATSHTLSDANDFSNSPIKRIGSFGNSASVAANKLDNSNEAEDDDFDLSSMINITVLSDIKTIRQDLQRTSALPQPNNRSKQPPLRHRDNEQQQERNHAATNVRMSLTRSRTLQEFNYRGRYQQQQQSDSYRIVGRASALASRQMSSFDSTNSYHQSIGYSSIPYDWQYDQQQRLAQAGNRAIKLTTQKSDLGSLNNSSQIEPKDEKAAKIIETFKAQILARAASSNLPESNKPDKDSGEKLSEKKSNNVRKTEAPTGHLDTSKSTGSGDLKSSIQNDDAPNAQSKPGKVLESSGKDSGQSKPKTPTTSNISNIPRLITLHNLKASRSNESSKVEAESPTEGKSSLSKSTALSTKIVSQYRQLRGKSLADELDDAAK